MASSSAGASSYTDTLGVPPAGHETAADVLIADNVHAPQQYNSPYSSHCRIFRLQEPRGESVESQELWAGDKGIG